MIRRFSVRDCSGAALRLTAAAFPQVPVELRAARLWPGTSPCLPTSLREWRLYAPPRAPPAASQIWPYSRSRVRSRAVDDGPALVRCYEARLPPLAIPG